MLAIAECQGVRYPFRVVLSHPLLRKQGFAYWHGEKERIDCGLNDAVDATTLLFAKRADAERLVEKITSDLSSDETSSPVAAPRRYGSSGGSGN